MGYSPSSNAVEVSSIKSSMISSIKSCPLYKDKEFLHQKYVVERLSPGQISDIASSSRMTIAKYIRVFGLIKTGDRSSFAQLNYWQSVKGRSRSVCKREQAIIVKMKAIRTAGWSYGKIAELVGNFHQDKKREMVFMGSTSDPHMSC